MYPKQRAAKWQCDRKLLCSIIYICMYIHTYTYIQPTMLRSSLHVQVNATPVASMSVYLQSNHPNERSECAINHMFTKAQHIYHLAPISSSGTYPDHSVSPPGRGCRSPSPLSAPTTAGTRNLDPILPLLRNLHHHGTHHGGASHQPVAFTLQHSHLAPLHRLAQPPHVLDWHPRVSAPVMYHDGPGNVDVAEADGLAPLQAHQEVDCRVGARGRELPDFVGETRVIYCLPLAVLQCRRGDCEDRVAID